MIVGSKSIDSKSKEREICYAKLRVYNIDPTYLMSFPVTYYFGILAANGKVENQTESIQASSYDLIPFSEHEIDVISKQKFIAKKNWLSTDDTVTLICQVRILLWSTTIRS